LAERAPQACIRLALTTISRHHPLRWTRWTLVRCVQNQVLEGHGRPSRTTLSRPSDCAKYEIMLDVALHFGPEDHSCAEKLNKNNDQVGRETLQLFKSGLKRDELNQASLA